MRNRQSGALIAICGCGPSSRILRTPLGTTANVVVSSTINSYNTIGVLRMINPGNGGAPYYANHAEGKGVTLTLDLTLAAGQVAVAVAGAHLVWTSATWTGLDQDYFERVNAGQNGATGAPGGAAGSPHQIRIDIPNQYNDGSGASAVSEPGVG